MRCSMLLYVCSVAEGPAGQRQERGCDMGEKPVRTHSASLARCLVLFTLLQAQTVTCRLAYPRSRPNAAFLPQQIRLDLHARSLPQKGGNGLPSGRSRAPQPPFDGRWLSRVRGGGGGSGMGGGGGEHGGGGGGRGDGNEEGGNGGNMQWSGMASVMGSLWNQYSVLLQDKPLRTKAITAGFIAIVGDLLAQSLEKGWFFNTFCDAAASKKYDTARSLAVLIDGLVVTGPGLHYLYTFLERLIPSQKGFWAAAVHVAVDELIFDPLFVLGFFFLCGALEGRDVVRDIIPQVKREYWSALKGGWAVSLLFLPIEFSTFRFLPVHLRVLMVNLTDVMWTAVVSYFSHHAIDHPPVLAGVPTPAA